LRRELALCLRTGRALRKPRRRATERRGRIPGMVSISERSAPRQVPLATRIWAHDCVRGAIDVDCSEAEQAEAGVQ
jgi:IS30 family transposase